ncbi:MAG TPA: hypothetical protein VGL78_01540 [Solirubrobacteraceae bacterium]|jgi:hypothetical protein
MSTLKMHAKRSLSSVRETMSEMNYAQRRLVEIKLGTPPEESRYRSTKRREIEELEALFELEPATAESERLV